MITKLHRWVKDARIVLKSPPYTEWVFVMVFSKKFYPECLRHIPDPPEQLYYRGNTELLNTKAIAIVGSRAMTSYGEKACTFFACELARCGLVIVSGLATGIDGVAHRAALDVHGKTIAVLGNGLDPKVLFPPVHRRLAEAIVKNGGLLISEYPSLEPARRAYFPQRNRIIAALAVGTLIVEAAHHSGALVTAMHALDYNRDVFAVPGPIFSSRSTGTNDLIQHGAKLVVHPSDILEEFGIAAPDPKQRATQLSLEQHQIIEHLQTAPLSAEQLVLHTGFSPLAIMTTLTELEIQGIVRKNREQNYEISDC